MAGKAQNKPKDPGGRPRTTARQKYLSGTYQRERHGKALAAELGVETVAEAELIMLERRRRVEVLAPLTHPLIDAVGFSPRRLLLHHLAGNHIANFHKQRHAIHMTTRLGGSQGLREASTQQFRRSG